MLGEFPDDFVPEEHVVRAVKNSDCRSALIFAVEDGDPLPSLTYLAKKCGSTIWNFDLKVNSSAEYITDYMDVGIKNGDWIYISNCDSVNESFFRKAARVMYKLEPEPDKYPRREFFRAAFSVSKHFNINGPGPIQFPPLLMQTAIIARKTVTTNKWSLIIPVDDPLFVETQKKHRQRRLQGRDSDSESDLEEGHPITGARFYRSAELSKFVDNSPLAKATELLEAAVRSQDVHTILDLVGSGDVDISKNLIGGMTPLQFACSAQLIDAAMALLEAGADPNQVRQSDGRPPLFMYLQDVSLASALANAGADLYRKFQGCRADNHPDTDPTIAAYLRKRMDL